MIEKYKEEYRKAGQEIFEKFDFFNNNMRKVHYDKSR